MAFTSYDVDADKKFAAAIARARLVTDDLTIPLTQISKDFYKSEKAIFMLKSAGKYPDLSTKPFRAFWKNVHPYAHLYEGGYKQYKQENFGFQYPILKRTGRLEASLTNPADADAVNQIINKRTLIIGTEVEYGIYHQSDAPRTKIPLRKFLFIGPESTFATSDQQGRVGRWLNIMNSHVLKKMGAKAT